MEQLCRPVRTNAGEATPPNLFRQHIIQHRDPQVE